MNGDTQDLKSTPDCEPTEYNEEIKGSSYVATKEDIENHIEKLKNMCIHAKMPFFACVATKPKVQKEDGDFETEYVLDSALPYTLGVKLEKDYISSMLLVFQGFSVREDIPMELEIDDEIIDEIENQQSIENPKKSTKDIDGGKVPLKEKDLAAQEFIDENPFGFEEIIF